MTLHFPDLSHFDTATIVPGTPIVIAKATQAVTIIDGNYNAYKRLADVRNAYFLAYHWLNAGFPAMQASHCYSVVGKTPLMIDAEDMSGNTGYTSPLTVQNIANFISLYRGMGGITHLVYLPHWYWQDHMGSPNLRPLGDLGMHLVSSNYNAYTDDGPGWTPYGGMTPIQWQYTSTARYGGDNTVDMNATKLSLAEYKTLTYGGTAMATSTDQSLNGWNVGVVEDGQGGWTPDNRGVGIWAEELWTYLQRGTGIYDRSRNDPNGAPNSMYLDGLLKLILAEVRKVQTTDVAITLTSDDKTEIANMVITGLMQQLVLIPQRRPIASV